ncbi:MAG: lipopolysaccharide biosynthesis protein, partial [Devosia sp.]|uniref:rhamnan synthesis F family protein n=1 Tax=Devosia sp. TaxID=1871048 RepID=UPI00262B7E3F
TGLPLNPVRFLYQNVFLPLMQVTVRAVLMPGLIVSDWVARARLDKQGDVVLIEQFAQTNDGVFCVFHLYQPHGLPANVVNAIALLAELGIRVVAVSNTPLPQSELARLRPYLHTFIQRRNFGRDFGGYRRGVLHVLDRHAPDKLLVLNDSVFYAKRGLREFFTSLRGEAQFIGASENHELSHHIGSYALSFGSQVIADPHFRRYWQDYRSTEIRPRVIRKGEAALSKLIVQTMKIRPRVIYSLQRLEGALNRADWRQLAVSAAQMPQGYFGQNPLRQLVREARKPMRDALSVSRAALLDSASLTLPIAEDDLIAEMNTQYRRELQRDLLDYVFRGSQIHWGALLLTQYLEMPIIKLDLVLRSIYQIGELGSFAPFLEEDEFTEFHALVTARGVPLTHGTLKQKLMMMTGLM